MSLGIDKPSDFSFELNLLVSTSRRSLVSWSRKCEPGFTDLYNMVWYGELGYFGIIVLLDFHDSLKKILALTFFLDDTNRS